MSATTDEAKKAAYARAKARRRAKAEAEGRPYIERGPRGQGRAKTVRDWTPGSSILVPEVDPL